MVIGQAIRRMTTAVFVLALVAAAPLATTAQTEQDSDIVNVTATIDALPISISICDLSADFGTGLDADGAPATSTDGVQAIAGDAGAGEGALYEWTPSCDAGESFITVISSNPWTGEVCGAQTGGTSNLTLDDLRLSAVPHVMVGNPFQTALTGSTAFTLCPSQTPWLDLLFNPGTIGTAGTTSEDFYYCLNIARDSTDGTFTATTTWSVAG